jgi:hypothetical protein
MWGIVGMFSRREHGVGILASSNTIFGSPVSQKVNDFINTSGSFRRRLIPKTIGSPIQTHLHLRTAWTEESNKTCSPPEYA